MIEEEKKESYKFIKFLLFLFIAFLIMYVSKEKGYYEYSIYTKSKLTVEEMKRFENDIKDGKNVSLNDYINSEYKDYSNISTRVGSSINKSVEAIMNKGIKKTLKIISALFYE